MECGVVHLHSSPRFLLRFCLREHGQSKESMLSSGNVPEREVGAVLTSNTPSNALGAYANPGLNQRLILCGKALKECGTIMRE